MAGNILTPLALWKNFSLDQVPTFEIIEEKRVKGILISEIYIHGRETEDGRVKIHCVWARKTQISEAPAVVVASDLKYGADFNFAVKLAEKGYVALAVDIGGKVFDDRFNKQRYTVYPPSLSYANYDDKVDEGLSIEGEVVKTCWYERSVALRYAVKFIKAQKIVGKVGAVGLFGGATALWHCAAFEELACAAIIGNAGWQGYRGIPKFGDTPEPQFNDDELKFIAGIDPQSYAMHVKCPTLILSPTNSAQYDMDRAADTVSRINDKIYTSLDYSIGSREEVDFSCFNDCMAFFDEFLLKGGNGDALPKSPTLKCSLKDGILNAEVTVAKNKLKDVSVYVSEEEVRPSLRSWEKVSRSEEIKDGVFAFNYIPYDGSKKVFLFARAVYEGGIGTSSVVLSRTLKDGDYKDGKNRVYYSSPLSTGVTDFYEANEGDGTIFGLRSEKTSGITLKKGTMDLIGLYSECGFLTFKINEEKYKPIDGSMFMFDVCVISGGNLSVKLVTDYFGDKREYIAAVKTFGEGVWQNVKLELNNFKTKDGMGIKSYRDVQAMEFVSDGAFLLNNFLWV